MLAGIDPALTAGSREGSERGFDVRVRGYWPRGQRLLAGAANVLAAYGGLWGQGARGFSKLCAPGNSVPLGS